MLVSILAFMAASVAGPAMANPPSGGDEKAVAQESVEETGTPGIWWLYVSALGLGGLTALGWALYRVVGEGEVESRDTGGYKPGAEPAGASSLAAESSTPGSGLEEAEETFFSVDESSPSDQAAQFALAQSDGPERVCPECGERFSGAVVLCPNDSTPLRKIAEPRGQSEDDSGGVLERKMCPGCERRYPERAKFCYHDGFQLHRDTVDDAEGAPVYRACETCGFETRDERRICPEDGTELVTVDPEGDERLRPPVPVMKCPECGEIAPPDRAECPEDGTVLTPLLNAHADHLPYGGYGPDRKICEDCGGRYAKAAEYCPQDGTELTPLN